MKNPMSYRHEWKLWLFLTLLSLIIASYSLKGPWLMKTSSMVVLGFLLAQTDAAFKLSRKSVDDLVTEALSRLPAVYIRLKNGSQVVGPVAKLVDKKYISIHVIQPFYFDECRTVTTISALGKQDELVAGTPTVVARTFDVQRDTDPKDMTTDN